MKVLITGFDPFGGEKINPAYEAVKRIKDKLGNIEVVKAEIPTVFGKSLEVLEGLIEKEKPDAVICVGQAGGRAGITIERVAINQDDARIPDNEGNTPIDLTISEDGENAYFSSLPIKSIVENSKKENIQCSISNTAGTYVCNHVMYGLLYMIDKKFNGVKGGFIHVPFIPEQVLNRPSTPAMSINDITRGLEVAIETSVNIDNDIKVTGGQIC